MLIESHVVMKSYALKGRCGKIYALRLGVISIGPFQQIPCSVGYSLDNAIKLVDALGRPWVFPMETCGYALRISRIQPAHTLFYEVYIAWYYPRIISW